MSTSQALGIKRSLIMLISVQTLTPKLRWSEVQHWMAVASRSFSSIHSSITTPSFAICTSDGGGTPPMSA